MIISCLGSAAVSYFIHNSFLSLLAGGVTFCVILAVCMLTFGANKAEKELFFGRIHKLKSIISKT